MLSKLPFQAAMVREDLREAVFRDLALLACVGVQPVVVHGGGPEINQWLGKLAIEPRFQDGLRVTSPDTMDVVEMVLVGRVNKQIVNGLNRVGGRAVGLSGSDGGLVLAHGTGTPQNRTSESAILSQTAGAFGIDSWPVVAVKSYLGHSIGAAAGDQLAATLGIWQHGILPGITTIDAIAEDVQQQHLSFSRDHREVDPGQQQYAIINSKGFGGNNASATLLSPGLTSRMLQRRYSKAQWQAWQGANEAVRERQRDYDDGMIAGTINPVYKFDHGVLGDSDVEMDANRVTVGGSEVDLGLVSPYTDMLPGAE